MEVNLISKKESCKLNLVLLSDSNNGKVVLILLTEFIIFYIGLIVIDIRGLGLELIPDYELLFKGLKKYLDDLV